MEDVILANHAVIIDVEIDKIFYNKYSNKNRKFLARKSKIPCLFLLTQKFLCAIMHEKKGELKMMDKFLVVFGSLWFVGGIIASNTTSMLIGATVMLSAQLRLIHSTLEENTKKWHYFLGDTK